MSEWWTYSPSDLVMYSASTYLRLVGAHNGAIWPAQLAALLAGAVLALGAAHHGLGARRARYAVLAAAWAAVAVSWFFIRFATIHTLASWFGAAFLVECALLAWLAATPTPEVRRPGRERGGVFIAAVAVFGCAAAGLLTGREVEAVELFGVMPTPTALATLALLPTDSRAGRTGFAIPVAWLAWDLPGFQALGLPEWIAIAAIIPVVAAGRYVVGRRSRVSRDPLSTPATMP